MLAAAASSRLGAPLRRSAAQQRGVATLISKYLKSVNEFGLKGTIMKLYTNGDVKFGKKVGEDQFGNEYFENAVDYPYGQHRWVENMKQPHDFCPSMVPAEWHSWLHSTTDHLPTSERAFDYKYLKANEGANNIYQDDHVGGVFAEHRPNESGYKDRAYGFGSRYSEHGNEKQYLQPGHVLNRYGRNDKYDPHRESMELADLGSSQSSRGESSTDIEHADKGAARKRLRSLKET